MDKNALVVGGVALDILFPIEGDIRKEIPLKNGKLRNVNMTFLVRKSQYYFGGTAANIAYGLGLLGFKPLMFSTVGEDFNDDFRSHLEKHSVICKPIVGPEGSKTATSFQISDDFHQQITIFQTNYYGDRIDDMSLLETISKSELERTKIAIFSPGNNLSTLNNTLEFRRINKEATVIFDPGMNVTTFTKENLIECASLSNILISNDVEILRIRKVHKLSIDDLLKVGLENIIETKGERGSTIHTSRKKINVPPKKPKIIVETTGAGDAYRAGMIGGLLQGKTLKSACLLGAKLGSKCVESYGGQEYTL